MARFGEACRIRYDEALLASIGEPAVADWVICALRNGFNHVSPSQ
jgi:hypothetical protein